MKNATIGPLAGIKPGSPVQHSNHLGLVVQRWVSAKPGLKCNLLF